MMDISLKVYKKIQENFDKVNSVEQWKILFDIYLKNNNAVGLSFIKEKYNKYVLDRHRFENIEEFAQAWALIRWMKQDTGFLNDYNKRYYNKYDLEMERDKDIINFFKNHCRGKKEYPSFCSKLWHCKFPDEFPIYDKNINTYLKLGNIKFEIKIKAMIQGYKSYIEKNKDKLQQIREALADERFEEIRVQEVKDMRLIDMGLWATNIPILLKNLLGYEDNIKLLGYISSQQR